jgi:hypothetical protein
MTPSFLAAGRMCAVAALVSAAALVTACTSSSQPSAQPGNSASRSGGTGAPSPTGQGAGGASASPVSASPSPSHAAPAGPQPCASRDLGVHTGNGQGAAGSTYIPIVFTNNSDATCTLYGYPGVSLAGGSPVRQIGTAADENQATPRQLVTLAPGAAGSALLRIVAAQNFPAARCHQVPATYLQVYPPNQTTPIYVKYSSTACSKPVHLLTVDVVKSGSGG